MIAAVCRNTDIESKGIFQNWSNDSQEGIKKPKYFKDIQILINEYNFDNIDR